MEELTPEQELLEAKSRLAKAKARQAEAEQLKLSALNARVQAIQAERDRKAAAERAEYERAMQVHEERRRKEREQQQLIEREEASRNAELQRQIAAQEEIVKQQKAHEAEVAKLAAEAQALEEQAKQDQAEALRSLEFIETGIAKEIVPSAAEDVDHKLHPLSRFFNPEVAVVPIKDSSEISSEQQSKHQSAVDGLINLHEFGTTPVYAQSPATVEPQPKVEALSGRKPRPELDHATSGEIEQLLRKELGLNPSTLTLDSLSSRFYYGSLITATRAAIAKFKARPMSSDHLLQTIHDLCEQGEVTVKSDEEIRAAVAKAQTQYAEAVAQGTVGGSRG